MLQQYGIQNIYCGFMEKNIKLVLIIIIVHRGQRGGDISLPLNLVSTYPDINKRYFKSATIFFYTYTHIRAYIYG